MITGELWHTLNAALDDRMRTGQPVQLWLRDDDAIEPGQPLDHLLSLTHRYHIPLTLAVIPAHTGEALVDRIHDTQDVSVVVHGWSHQNHAPAGEKKQELGNHRKIQSVVAELRDGYSRLSMLHCAHFVPLLVPPWNRIHPSVVEQLTGIGFKALSTFGTDSSASPPVKVLNTHLDIMDWKGTRGGRDPVALVKELIALVGQDTQPIGILTHHLVHDKQAWVFLEELFATLAGREDCEWVSVEQLME